MSYYRGRLGGFFDWLMTVASSAMLSANLAFGGSWWSTLGWGVCFVAWAWSLTAGGRGPLRKWMLRVSARSNLKLLALVIVNLHVQGEKRPEIKDQVEWSADALRLQVPLLRQIAAGELTDQDRCQRVFDKVTLETAQCTIEIADGKRGITDRWMTWSLRRDVEAASRRLVRTER